MALKREWCPRCAWRTPHAFGVCQDCQPQEPAVSEKELEAEGQSSLFPPPAA
jgi:hypothetical protein